MSDSKAGKDPAIPLKIDGAVKYVKGATKYTTFGDVIKMVLKKTGIGKTYRHLFSIVEITEDDERQMCNKDRVLKAVQAWENDKGIFVLRKKDSIECPSTAENAKSEVRQQNRSKKKAKKIKHRNKPSVTPAKESKDDTSCDVLGTSMRHHAENDMMYSTKCDISSSDSDEELEQLISNLDQSKLSTFIKIFNSLLVTDSKKRVKSTSEDSEAASSTSASQHRPKARPSRLQYRQDRPNKPSEKPHQSQTSAIDTREVEQGQTGITYTLPHKQYIKYDTRKEDKCKNARKKRSVKSLSVKRYFGTKRSFDVIASEQNRNFVQEEYLKSRHGRGRERASVTSSKMTRGQLYDDFRTSDTSMTWTANAGFGATFVVGGDTKELTGSNIAFAASPFVGKKLVDYSLSEDELSDSCELVSRCNVDQLNRCRLNITEESDISCVHRAHGPRTDFPDVIEKSPGRTLCDTDKSKADVSHVVPISGMNAVEGNVSNESSGLETGDDSAESFSEFRSVSGCMEPDMETATDFIIRLFGKQCSVAQDEEMDSFMLSQIDEDENLTDEGFSCFSDDNEQPEFI